MTFPPLPRINYKLRGAVLRHDSQPVRFHIQFAGVAHAQAVLEAALLQHIGQAQRGRAQLRLDQPLIPHLQKGTTVCSGTRVSGQARCGRAQLRLEQPLILHLQKEA